MSYELIKQRLKLHGRFERMAKAIFYKALKAQVTPLINQAKLYGRVDIDGMDNKPMVDAYSQIYEKVGVYAARLGYNQIKKQESKIDQKADFITFENERWRRLIQSYILTDMTLTINDVNDNTREAIRIAMARAISEGQPFYQVAEAIENASLGIIGKYRAIRLARTEITTAMNKGLELSGKTWAAQSNSRMYKKWLGIPDGRERPSHLQEHIEPPIPMEDKFNVDKKESITKDIMNIPGDPSASPENRINCRCTVIYMSDRYANKRYGVNINN